MTASSAPKSPAATGSWTVTGMRGFVSYGTQDGLDYGGQVTLDVTLNGLGSGLMTIVLGIRRPAMACVSRVETSPPLGCAV